MGHLEPGGAASGSSALDRPADPLWPLWKQVAAEFRTSRLLKAAFGSGAGWGFYGVDLVSGLHGGVTARRTAALLSAVDDATLVRLIELAAVNLKRNDGMWRLAVMFYVTVPATLLIAGLDAAPDLMAEIFRPVLWTFILMLPLLTLQLLFYFATQWRAGQIVGVLEMIRIERTRT